MPRYLILVFFIFGGGFWMLPSTSLQAAKIPPLKVKPIPEIPKSFPLWKWSVSKEEEIKKLQSNLEELSTLKVESIWDKSQSYQVEFFVRARRQKVVASVFRMSSERSFGVLYDELEVYSSKPLMQGEKLSMVFAPEKHVLPIKGRFFLLPKKHYYVYKNQAEIEVIGPSNYVGAGKNVYLCRVVKSFFPLSKDSLILKGGVTAVRGSAPKGESVSKPGKVLNISRVLGEASNSDIIFLHLEESPVRGDVLNIYSWKNRKQLKGQVQLLDVDNSLATGIVLWSNKPIIANDVTQ